MDSDRVTPPTSRFASEPWVRISYEKFTQNPLIRVGTLYKFSPTGGGILFRAPAVTALSKHALFITEWRHGRILKVRLHYHQQKQLTVKV